MFVTATCLQQQVLLSIVRAKKKGKKIIPIFIQKLRVRVIYECVLYSNKYGIYQVPWKKRLQNNWTKSRWDPTQWFGKYSRNLGVCQRCLHMYCRPLESIMTDSPWNVLWSVAGEMWWRLPFTGHEVTAFLLEFCVCVSGVESQPFTIGV